MIDAVNCDGADPVINASVAYQIPLATLQLPPFSLTQGTQVVAKMQATNALGTSTESSPSSVTALVEVVPHKPNTSLLDSLTHEMQIQLTYDALTDVVTGGSSILSLMAFWL